ncbi:hypothetical protein BDY21DRAFT_363409 [Lineolata rhizophorae]|uniref:Uncharacterized protein n=1 Tax=Lineolata rhizophorae TaxID=578093 RepID=A0A6A6P1B2_9PEZI|nr:hypothetical protein BDY21DRAFT_363409 [Lineolata rhizophorae]
MAAQLHCKSRKHGFLLSCNETDCGAMINEQTIVREPKSQTLLILRPPEYVESREKLSNSAYVGDWSTFWKTVKNGKDEFEEDWINYTRIKPSSMEDQVSL